MKQAEKRTPSLRLFSVVLLSMFTTVTSASIDIPEIPLLASQSFKPLTMLVVGRDHTLFFEAYNDASDIDEDGVLDIRFKPSITYYGLFDSKLCYTQSKSTSTSPDKSAYFKPSSLATDGKCPGKWSGNWLNYATTSRMDALRKVLYGGHRDTDTDTQTILRRAYIPQDGHSWGKEYTSDAVDGYKISDYTPLSQPTGSNRHFFGNLTMSGPNCKTNLDTCTELSSSDAKATPLLSVVTNSDKRIWDWASSAAPVLREDKAFHGGSTSATDKYTVRVEVCTSTFHDGCKKYPDGNYKPVGLLHTYGESEAMLFGLLTGSYDKNMSGGLLRKVVSSFKDEIVAKDGRFSTGATLVNTLNQIRIRDFSNGFYRNASYRSGPMLEGAYVDWGNPVGEMMYETLRYFAGKKTPTTAYSFSWSGSHDAAVFSGLTPPSWDDPYSSTSAAKAPWCAKPNMLVVSSANVSYDSDQIPGSAFKSFSGDLSGLDASARAKKITDNHPEVPGPRFIGAVGTFEDYAPTEKMVTTLGNIRGLAPEEPTRQGSYYSASVSFYGKTTDLNPAKGEQKTDTYVVSLASTLPRLEFNVSGRLISLVPFAKTIDGIGAVRTKGSYQPTDPIVDLYIEEYSSAKVKFRINYEADEQGNDFDMDMIVQYEIEVEPDGKSLKVTVTPLEQATGSNQNVGYVISGTDRDGTYLVVQDKKESLNYFLNVPPGEKAGYCNSTTSSDPSPFPSGCAQLPWISGSPSASVQKFSPGSGAAATTLNNPLWFAAKWGGFNDKNSNGIPDLAIEWYDTTTKNPNTFFPVQNPVKLEEALKKSFNSIIDRAGSSGNLAVNSTSITSTTAIFQSTYDTEGWFGDLKAINLTGTTIGTVKWKASENLPSTRNIFTYSGTAGIDFKWENLKDISLFGGSEDVLDYIRGDRSNEISQGGTFRDRTSVIGDIVHSTPYYAKDTNTVFVGANDGMLHAFDASTGVEQFAYIPSTLLSKLSTLADTGYIHTYFVDGEVAVSTQTQTAGKNILVGAPGRGAKGLFALNVTTPSDFKTSDILWEYTESTDNVLEAEEGPGDMGFVLGQPVIAKLNNGVTAAIVGNGYNSTNGDAVLFIFNLESGKLIRKFAGGQAGSNGLSTPTVFDEDGDGAIDYVYAGDLKGNVWKYDLTDKSKVANWSFGYKSGKKPAPLFTAKDSAGTVQPITAPVTVTVNKVTSSETVGKTFVFVGTGSYITSSDPANHSVQTWYGLIDDGKISGRSDLKQRTFSVINGTIEKEDGSKVAARAVSASTANDMKGKKGWYLDLVDTSSRGERMVSRSIIINALKPVLEASSIIPAIGDPCDAQGDGFINFIDPFTGARLDFVFIDTNGDGKFDASDMVDGMYPSSINPDIGMPGAPILVGGINVLGGTSGKIVTLTKNMGGKKVTGRMSWREIRE